MRNTVTNRVINFVRNVDTRVWLTVGVACVFVFAIWLVSGVVSGLSGSFNEIQNRLNERNEVYKTAIERLKDECGVVRTDLGVITTTYTYACDDGVEYTFEE